MKGGWSGIVQWLQLVKLFGEPCPRITGGVEFRILKRFLHACHFHCYAFWLPKQSMSMHVALCLCPHTGAPSTEVPKLIVQMAPEVVPLKEEKKVKDPLDLD